MAFINYRAPYTIVILLVLLLLIRWYSVDRSTSLSFPNKYQRDPRPSPGYLQRTGAQELSNLEDIEPYPKCTHVLTLLPGGRWANTVMEYGSLYGVIKDHEGFRIKPVLNDEMKTNLTEVFPNLSIPSFSEMGCSDKDLPFVTTEQVKAGFLKEKWEHPILSLPKYWLRDKYFIPAIDDLKQNEFQFHPRLVQYVERGLQSAKEDFLKTRPGLDQVIFVGLHVRRTDYARYIKKHNGTAVTEHYFYKAMKMVRDKFGPSVVFVSATDDPKWTKSKFSKFPDVYFSSKMQMGKIDPVHFDFALLSHCNHSIYSYGTFGYMTSILAGGHVIAANSYTVDKFIALTYARSERGQNWTIIRDPTVKM
ncbi:hypothetical protein TCAL_15177 [Tigriopus californicus]|uniref:L-Fucosyltransferase n=1 Tax=Tigriopus californicus TaxID=6832 RepID=A0A553NFG5_TIGCA|nr:galactoside alpha-(1,2)-fucosyltransferase 1-like [Tigriopus californicus]XP_059093472.1 galactoside alpha-(1,2)-fucosyltransferase 1-like [Tigriopus californicus]TRY64192.1 hypothetical protein TCAL_15177 [Tigriopus californicus]